MLCQICQKQAATVHVTEISHTHEAASPEAGAGQGGAAEVKDGAGNGATHGSASASGTPSAHAPKVEQRHLCERCAQRSKLPHSPVITKKGVAEVWKLLQQSAQRAREEGGLACPECGMTLSEFRSKGRFGCPRDYEVFQEHLKPLLLRIHNSTEHRGRLPGVDEHQRQRIQQLTQLRAQLEVAIKDEAYESAARLRDEIQGLEAQPGS
jgi:protein arginine kinase activator